VKVEDGLRVSLEGGQRRGHDQGGAQKVSPAQV